MSRVRAPSLTPREPPGARALVLFTGRPAASQTRVLTQLPGPLARSGSGARHYEPQSRAGPQAGSRLHRERGPTDERSRAHSARGGLFIVTYQASWRSKLGKAGTVLFRARSGDQDSPAKVRTVA